MSAAELSYTNLFVCYLPAQVDDQQLREIFGAHGRIVASAVMRDIHTGHSLGTGFVRYERPADAARALAALDGLALLGKRLSVQWAKKQHDRGSPAGGARQPLRKLFVRNVPTDVTAEALAEALAAHGRVEAASVHKDTTPDAAHTRRIAFVVFAEPGAAERALRAVHNTCPFPSCRGVPLLAKLSEDYSKTDRGPAHGVSPARLPLPVVDGLPGCAAPSQRSLSASGSSDGPSGAGTPALSACGASSQSSATLYDTYGRFRHNPYAGVPFSIKY